MVGDQQRGRGVPQPVKGDLRKLLLGRLSFVVSDDNIVKSLIRRAVVHHLSVFLDEDPLAALPVVPCLDDEIFPLLFQGLEPFCQKVGNGHRAVRGPGLGPLDTI